MTKKIYLETLRSVLGRSVFHYSKFRTKTWLEINNGARGTYNTNSQNKFKMSMLESSLCDYSDAYILFKWTITIARVLTPAEPINVNKKVVSKNRAPFTDCISEINNTQIENTQDIDAVMSIYNLIESSNNCSNKSRNLWQYYRNEPASTDDSGIKDLHVGDNNSALFEFKQKITDVTAAGGTKNVEMMMPWKYWNNFWRNF